MKFLKKLVIPALLFALAACNNGNAKGENSNPSQNEAHSYSVVLPQNVNGVLTFSASSLSPKANEKVRLQVKNLIPEEKRLDGLTMNGQMLESRMTEMADEFEYEFTMPANEDAIIEADIVDLFAIKVAEDVKDKITLDFKTPEVAAAGETVSFKVATYNGYWYKQVSLVENDVVLNEENGVYSFTMPAHDVTVTANYGAMYFRVDVESSDYYSITGVLDGDTFAAGETVEFNVTAVGPDTEVTKVLLEGNELEEVNTESHSYSFVMPAYGVALSAEYVLNARHVMAEENEHFLVKLTTMVDEQEVKAADNVFADQRVYIETEEIGEHLYLADGFEFEAGYSAEDMTAVTTISASVNLEGKTSFTMPRTYTYVKVKVKEKYAPYKNSSLVGTWKGYRPYFSSENSATIDTTGLFKMGYSSTMDISKMEGNHCSADDKELFFYNDEYLLYVEADTCSGIYLLGNNKSWNKENHSFALYMASSTASKKLAYEFIYATFNDGSSIGVAYDFATKEVVWNVTAAYANGSEFLGNQATKGDVVAITNSEGEISKFVEITTVSSLNDGYQHLTVEKTPDAFRGNYDGDKGHLFISGFGTGKLGAADVTYEAGEGDNQLIITTLDESVMVVGLSENSYEVQSFTYGQNVKAIVGVWYCEMAEGIYAETYVRVKANGTAIVWTPESSAAQLFKAELTFESREGEFEYIFNSDLYGQLTLTLLSENEASIIYEEGPLYEGSSFVRSEQSWPETCELDFINKVYKGRYGSGYSSGDLIVTFESEEKVHIVGTYSYAKFDVYTTEWSYNHEQKTIRLVINSDVMNLLVQDNGTLKVSIPGSFCSLSTYSINNYLNNTSLSEQ